MKGKKKEELKAFIEEILEKILAKRREMPVRADVPYITVGGVVPLYCATTLSITIDELDDLEVKQKVVTLADKRGETTQEVLDKLARKAMIKMASDFIRGYEEEELGGERPEQ